MTNNHFTPIFPPLLIPTNTENTIIDLMISHVSTLSYTDISPIDLYLTLKNDLKQQFHLTYYDLLITTPLSSDTISTYINSWKPTPEFIVEHTLNIDT